MQAKMAEVAWTRTRMACAAPDFKSGPFPIRITSLFFALENIVVLLQEEILERKIVDRVRIELTTQSLQDSVAALAHACPRITRRRSLLVLEYN
jgi:hypothetical protein